MVNFSNNLSGSDKNDRGFVTTLGPSQLYICKLLLNIMEENDDSLVFS